MPKKPAPKQKPRMMIIEQDGSGLFDIISSLVKGAKKTKAVSSIASGLSKAGIPVVSEVASVLGPIAGALGFGKVPPRKRTCKQKVIKNRASKTVKKGGSISIGGRGKARAKTTKKRGGSLALAGKRRTALR